MVEPNSALLMFGANSAAQSHRFSFEKGSVFSHACLHWSTTGMEARATWFLLTLKLTLYAFKQTSQKPWIDIVCYPKNTLETKV